MSDPFAPSECRAGDKTVIGQADGKMSEVTIAATRLGVVAAWADRPPDPGARGFGTPQGALHIQALESSGAPRGARVDLVPWSTPRVKLFALDDGTFLLAYGECCSKQPPGAYLLHLDANAGAIGRPIALPKADFEVGELSSSGQLAAALLTRSGSQVRTLLHIDTSTDPMQLFAQDLPDTASLRLALRPDGGVWVATVKPPGQLGVRIIEPLGADSGPSVDLPYGGELSVAANGDLILTSSFPNSPSVNTWQLHAGELAPTARKIPRGEAAGSATLGMSSLAALGASLDSLTVLRMTPGPGLSLARERRPMWRSDSTWSGTSYLVIYVDVAVQQTRDVVVQSVTCSKKK